LCVYFEFLVIVILMFWMCCRSQITGASQFGQFCIRSNQLWIHETT